MDDLPAIWSVLSVLVVSILDSVAGDGFGNCPKLPYMPNFNVSRFAGHWYEVERAFYLMELVSSCVTVDLHQNHKGQFTVNVNAKSIVSGSFSISQGLATPSKRDPSVLLYRVSSKLPRFLNRYLPGAGYYQVLQTDYTRYAIVYTCTDFHLFHMDLVWIWGRKKEINVEVRAKIYNILNGIGLDPERLTLPKNKNCTEDY
ncbi:apolipoprotein D-like [Rhynchophorus ferrugineus]|uniref:Lipocalin/cytosolic fatty-acid binding domain-containing protein n=1 Tax=Rhynchophorus ferrugineus TaxID=354439 RepID=A0A834IFV0_RHYFE|nr:hypothetical protein GWI33_006438 [Rhynchophorus ferrugineus]